jgi:hypothetical protein
MDPEAAKDSRRRARKDAAASIATVPGPEPEYDTKLPDRPETLGHEYFVDAEFVAIYW